jgi:hypothetical protein
MHHAAKRKTQFTASLAAVRLLLLLVVACGGLETRVWSFAATPQPASDEITFATPSFIGENYDGFAYDASDSLVAAKTTPVWPKTAQEMNAFLKVEGKAIPDTLTTPGRNKTVWELGPNKITLEQHPYHPNAPTWHKDPHWHLDTPGSPHQRFVPGDPIPGY